LRRKSAATPIIPSAATPPTVPPTMAPTLVLEPPPPPTGTVVVGVTTGVTGDVGVGVGILVGGVLPPPALGSRTSVLKVREDCPEYVNEAVCTLSTLVAAHL
jgi:hypothetical protein